MFSFFIMAFALSAHPAPHVACPSQTVEGLSTFGFESSYVRVDRGPRSGQMIWIQDANQLARVIGRPSGQRVVRRARVRVTGCILQGQFGHMNAFPQAFQTGAIILRL